MPTPPANLMQKLEAIVGKTGIIEDEARGPGPIVRPASSTEVAEVLKTCNAAKYPIVTMGGNTTMVQGTIRLRGERVVRSFRWSGKAGSYRSVSCSSPIMSK